MQDLIIRRRTNGTLDADSYRQHAIMMRAQMPTRFFGQMGPMLRPAVGIAAIVAVYISVLRLMYPETAAADVPSAIAAIGEILVTKARAVGAQVYECKMDSTGKLAWTFREPIASLVMSGKTVGRHYAGPNWEMNDGSLVTAKVAAQSPGPSVDDIPLLKLEVTDWRGKGQLSGITTIQRLNTRGGKAPHSCESAGAFLSVPYTADYAFYRKPIDQTSTR
ncbi:MAG TPA: DUF3455 domain-containing protein [Pseudolabrys sp.]|nr:DUF3455 domain-containing protein [Pseudolabrys sp.]